MNFKGGEREGGREGEEEERDDEEKIGLYFVFKLTTTLSSFLFDGDLQLQR